MLLTKVCEQIEKGKNEFVETLRDFLVIDRSLVDVLSHDYEYNLKASLVVRMKLHRFIQPTNEYRQIALNIVEILKTSYYLNNPSNYVEMGPEGADPTLLYPETSCPTNATLLVSQGQPPQPMMMGMNPYDQPMNPYSIPQGGMPAPNPYAVYGAPMQQPMVTPVPVMAPVQMLPPPAPGQHHLIYLDHTPDNNKKLVANLREHGTNVYVITTAIDFTRFVTSNYSSIVAHIGQGNTLRIMCDRQFATDFEGNASGVDIISALGGMGLTGIKILVYCWRIELVSHLSKFGVIVTKDVKLARDFGNFMTA
eukprot:gnl/Chilomastix_caulleri/257.p1 GENE.gnl/Chilomastix_caulleri/257~~gnl/Chilomastix_caulleri/257.p1  ORF type:complete len:309 (+),score=87.80 gnl/Chilomastix_caulleri/257:67-993(+)